MIYGKYEVNNYTNYNTVQIKNKVKTTCMSYQRKRSTVIHKTNKTYNRGSSAESNQEKRKKLIPEAEWKDGGGGGTARRRCYKLNPCWRNWGGSAGGRQ